MANSTSTLDLVQQSQSSKEITINHLFNSCSPSMLFARRESTSSALTWGYYGGVIVSPTTGAFITINNGTLNLAASSTNYVQCTAAGAILANTTGFVAGNIPLYQVGCNANTAVNWTDFRQSPLAAQSVMALAISGNTTLTADQARCHALVLTGTLSAQANIVMPTVSKVTAIINQTTGGFGVQAIQAAGTGVVIANARSAFVLTGQTNVIRLTPDA